MQLEDHGKSRKVRLRVKIYLFLGCTTLFLILFIAAAAYLPILRINDFIVSGTDRVDPEELLENLKMQKLDSFFGKIFGYNSILLWNESEAKFTNRLIATIFSKKDWFKRTVTINVKERSRYLIWCAASGTCVWLDDEGEAIEPAIFSEGQLINVVFSDSDKNVSLGTKVFPDKNFQYLKKIITILRDNNIPLEQIKISENLLEATAHATNSTAFYFSLRFDPAFTVGVIESLKTKPYFTKAAYFDFRIENKIYYKLR